MTKAILLATVFVAFAVAKDSKSEPSILRAISNEGYYGSGADRGKIFDDKNIEFSEAENRIIQDVYSPDYYEPNIILDYRYLKSGGRGYARSDGGQVLILPRRNRMPPPQNNFDILLEYLRLKHLEQISKPYNPNSRLRGNYGGFVGENINNRRDDIGNTRDNRWQNIREKENMRGGIRENIKNSDYNSDKLDRHDIENKFQSDAELGLAIYKQQ